MPSAATETVYGSVPSYGQQPVYGQPAYPAGPTPDAKNDGGAIASLVLGILSFVTCLSVLTGIPAIVLGHMSRSRIRQSMGRLKGDGMALSGLIMGYLSVVSIPVVLIIVAIAIPNLIRARIAANESHALGTLQIISRAEEAVASNDPASGYSDDLKRVHAPATCRTGMVCVAQGYYISVSVDSGTPHRAYVVSAIPVVPKTTGNRGFCATEDGIFRIDNNPPQGHPEGYTEEECAALSPIQ